MIVSIAHDEKQVYPPYNKKPLQEFKRLKQGKNKIDLKKDS